MSGTAQGNADVIFTKLDIAGAYVIEPTRREDERGFFARLWCAHTMRDHGLGSDISQINTAVSPKERTLRGLHYQLAPHAEVKVVRCVRGAVYDVVVDLRPQSSSYRRWAAAELSAANGRVMYVPEGCAHGYLTLASDTELIYLTSRPYAPEAARGVRFNDPAFSIEWVGEPAIVSEADRSWPDWE
jgi:dTDP-4-dehydrorhamnose 3,5-epimerase